MSFMQMLSMATGKASPTQTPPPSTKPSAASTSLHAKSPAPSKPTSKNRERSVDTTAVGGYSMSEEQREAQRLRVERLKAARRVEEEKSGKVKPKPKPKKTTTSSGPSSRPPSRTGSSGTKKNAKYEAWKPDPVSTAPVKKLTYEELMAEANQVNTENLKVSLKVRTAKEREAALKRQHHQGALSKSNTGSPAPDSRRSAPPASRAGSVAAKPRPRVVEAAPVPLARPMDSLRKKREENKRKKHNDYDDGSDMSDFVVESEGEEAEQGYRQEIRNMFRRGRRNYENYDSDSDDMEATGGELMEEEMRSTRQALLDDKREEEEIQRRAREKRDKKKRRV